ncbi:putative membrane protein [Pseudomonas duriflava]|uniref:Putative membrane protein n=1 Tax=Pseudomonas duriflava TaxID=459528 RepID=A0A562QG66_9PSED|nr:DUF2269 domain-containing protein [Pseudomonas duriflava]TWI55734.1 putative membrane protein [Pseudomonas duriflava]
MTAYVLLKTVHVLSAAILIGLGSGSAYYAWRSWRTGRPEFIALTFKHLVFADWAITLPCVVIQAATGIALAHGAGFSLTLPWLQWSIIFFLLAGLCWLPILWLQVRLQRLAETSHRHKSPLPPQAFRYMRAWLILGWPAFLALLVVLYLMISKGF